MGARREVVSAVTERYRSAKRAEKGRMLDALCAVLSSASMRLTTTRSWSGRNLMRSSLAFVIISGLAVAMSEC